MPRTYQSRQVPLPDLRRLHRLGWSARRIARHFGVNSDRIRALCRKDGLEVRPVGSLPGDRKLPLDTREIAALYRAGRSSPWIARRYRTTDSTIRARLREAGVPLRRSGPPRGPAHPGWRGGRYIDHYGYAHIYSPDHPHADAHGRVSEHRLVMEKMLGRYVLPTEVVHHNQRARSKHDNRPECLELYSANGEHLRMELRNRPDPCSREGRERTRQASIRRWQAYRRAKARKDDAIPRE